MAAAAAHVTLENVEERPYQEAIAEACQGRNALVVLPTGLGKTVICARVMARHVEMGERVLVLAPTRPLVEQHARTFRDVLPATRVEVVTGSDRPEDRAGQWGGADVVVATPQVARNDLVAERLDPAAWGLLVVDEAHRAVGNYAAVDVAEAFRGAGVRLLAATASPGSSPQRVREVCQALGIEHVEARGEWDEDVRGYVEPIKAEWLRVVLPRSLENAASALRKLAEKEVGTLRAQGLYASRFLNRKELLRARGQLLKRVGGSTGQSASRGLGAIGRTLRLLHAISLVETQSSRATKAYLERLANDEPELAASASFVEAKRLVTSYLGEHPKMRRCAAELQSHLRQAPDARAIVFVQYRDTAAALAEQLGRVAGVRPALFVGQGGKDGLTQKEQLARIEGLRAGEHNVLVATSVGEEGLDLPSVGLVVFYEPVPSAVRAIQRKGRTGRQGAGRVVVLMARGTADEATYWSQANKERQMRHVISALQTKRPRASAPPTIRPNVATAATGDDERPRVLVDHREFNGPLARALAQAGLALEPTTLPVADVVLSNRVAVERKSARDLVASIYDGRLMEQARALKRNFEAPLLVVEGDPFDEAPPNRHAAVAGALAAVTGGFGLAVLTVADAHQAATVVAALARREHEVGAGPPTLRHGSAGRTREEQQQYLVEGLPHVSATLAHRLLEHFGTPAAVFAATEDALRKVRGIGPTTARAIHDVLHAAFETPWQNGTSRSYPARAPTTRSGTGAARSGS